MKYRTSRELSGKSGQIWKELESEKEIIITLNGKPKAMLTYLDENRVDEQINVMRKAIAANALFTIRQNAILSQKNQLTMDAINQEIKSVRKQR